MLSLLVCAVCVCRMDSQQAPPKSKNLKRNKKKSKSFIEKEVKCSEKTTSPVQDCEPFLCEERPEFHLPINSENTLGPSVADLRQQEKVVPKTKRCKKKKKTTSTEDIEPREQEINDRADPVIEPKGDDSSWRPQGSLDNDSLVTNIESIANISASFIPAVEEALRLLEAAEDHMNFPETSQASRSKKSTNSKKKNKSGDNPGGEADSIVSLGAQRLVSDILNSFNPSTKQTSETLAFSSSLSKSGEGSVLNSQDTELLKSASNFGPIYSRSAFSSSVTVTSSSLSSQLSSERTHSSHLYGSTFSSVCSEIPSTSAVSLSGTMSAPASQQSREEVEAERKARKAAKAAAKGKAKGSTQEPASTMSPSKPDQNLVKHGTSARKIDNVSKPAPVSSKPPTPNTIVDELTKDVKNLHISKDLKQAQKNKTAKAEENRKKNVEPPTARAADEPDFARTDAFRAPCMENIPKGVKFMMTKVESEIDTVEGVEKSKSELRAERRAKQEAQRATKAQQQLGKQKIHQQVQQNSSLQPTSKSQPKDIKSKEHGKPGTAVKVVKELKDTKAERRVKLFSHLYQNSFKNISQSLGVSHPQYHLSIVRLGVQYANRVVLGSNARCLALLYSLKHLIADYETPPQKEFSRGFEAYLQPNMDLLQQCRPYSVSMVNALRYIKWQLTQIPVGDSESKSKQHILDAIDQYIDDQIGKAAEAIGKVVKDKIDNNDVILVYACSSLVLSALKVALEEKRKFHVIVVDSLPWLEGREMLRRLVSMGVQCSYVHISAASFVMRQVSKVLLGAHALLANGYVMSRAGSSQVALLAHAYNVPVLVCCETHKFSERVQTDSFVYNELADPDELIGSKRAGERETEHERPLANWRDIPSLSLLNLVYDVTPPDLVTAVVTERAILPCTSVPVILRIKPTEC